jgi:hypothetical protein
MSLLFHYRLTNLPRPAVSLGGRWVRPRPVVTVTLVGPASSRALPALLDTGADDTVFAERDAVRIGVDLSNAPMGRTSGLAMAPVPVRYAQLTLRLTDGQEFRQWQGWVGFTPAPMFLPVLGFAGCLQFFSALFRGDREEVELEVNSLYPGR